MGGGLDSSALAWALRPAAGLVIDYGQAPARGEARAAVAVGREVGIEVHTLKVDLSAVGSGLLATGAHGLAAAQRGESDSDGPSLEWWPYRNQLLVTTAAAWAYGRGFSEILTGTVRRTRPGTPTARAPSTTRSTPCCRSKKAECACPHRPPVGLRAAAGGLRRARPSFGLDALMPCLGVRVRTLSGVLQSRDDIGRARMNQASTSSQQPAGQRPPAALLGGPLTVRLDGDAAVISHDDGTTTQVPGNAIAAAVDAELEARHSTGADRLGNRVDGGNGHVVQLSAGAAALIAEAANTWPVASAATAELPGRGWLRMPERVPLRPVLGTGSFATVIAARRSVRSLASPVAATVLATLAG